MTSNNDETKENISIIWGKVITTLQLKKLKQVYINLQNKVAT